MKPFACTRILFLAAALMVGAWSCGGSGGKDEGTAKETASQEVAKNAKVSATELTDAPFKGLIESAGYEVVSVTRFPPAQAGKKGYAVIYRSPDGGHGGILYAEANAQGYDLIWHWYFDDDVPLSIEPVEVNGDGLWDARLKMKDGKSVDYIQDQTFTLAAGPRDDRIALNGESSAPVAARFPLWQCFDGDSTTTWTSSARAYVDLPAPLGIESGVLMVRTADVDRPKKCKVVADGKTVREFELENRAGLQTVDLGEQVRKARKVRFEIDSSYGSGDVAIAELELK